MTGSPTAIFDYYVDDELVCSFHAMSRGDANDHVRMLYSEHRCIAFAFRRKLVVRGHAHEPAAENMSVCLFCQAIIDPPPIGWLIA